MAILFTLIATRHPDGRMTRQLFRTRQHKGATAFFERISTMSPEQVAALREKWRLRDYEGKDKG